MNKKNKSRNALSKVAKLLLRLTKIFLSWWSFMIMSTFYILISKCQYTTKRFSPNKVFSCIIYNFSIPSLWYFPINRLFLSKNNDNSNLYIFELEGKTPVRNGTGRGWLTDIKTALNLLTDIFLSSPPFLLCNQYSIHIPYSSIQPK